MDNLQRKIYWSMAAAGVIYLVFIVVVLALEWEHLTEAVRIFPWVWLPGALGLTLINYVGRLIKWQWYLDVIDVDIPKRDSARVFGVGMLMVMTPGKAGEFLKSFMVRNVTGTPMGVTAPVVLAERLTDGFSMLLLASLGLFAFPDPRTRLAAVVFFIGFLAFVTIIQVRPLALRLLDVGTQLPVARRFASQLHNFYESSYIIFRPKNLAISLFIGVTSWLAEGLAYFLILIGFGLPFDAQTGFIAVFIFCISTIVGALLATPGGVGGMEGSMIALGTQLLPLDIGTATAAALLTRLCTLWFGVLIGIVSFALWPRLLAGVEGASREQAVVGD